MSVQGKITASINLTEGSAVDFGSAIRQILASFSLTLDNGTGDNQADLVFADQRTLAASATENLDLAGALAQTFGATLTMAKLKAMYFKAADGNTNNVIIGNVTNGIVGPFGAATHSILVPPGGVFLWAGPKTGQTITAGTQDLIKVANSGGGTGVTYDVVLLGTSV